MRWSRASADIGRLVGKKLRSISGRANIRLRQFGPQTYAVERANGGLVVRPTIELKKLVRDLASGKPIHVDRALHGSRTSRSHPETVLANLPEVEWLKRRGRKHIVWAGTSTHRLGTLKKQ